MKKLKTLLAVILSMILCLSVCFVSACDDGSGEDPVNEQPNETPDDGGAASVSDKTVEALIEASGSGEEKGYSFEYTEYNGVSNGSTAVVTGVIAVADGKLTSDAKARVTQDGTTVYLYSFLRGNYRFAYVADDGTEITDWTGITLEQSPEPVGNLITNEIGTIGGNLDVLFPAVLGVAKATKSLQAAVVEGGYTLTVNIDTLYQTLFAQIAELLGMVKADTTVGQLLANPYVQSYINALTTGFTAQELLLTLTALDMGGASFGSMLEEMGIELPEATEGQSVLDYLVFAAESVELAVDGKGASVKAGELTVGELAALFLKDAETDIETAIAALRDRISALEPPVKNASITYRFNSSLKLTALALTADMIGVKITGEVTLLNTAPRFADIGGANVCKWHFKDVATVSGTPDYIYIGTEGKERLAIRLTASVKDGAATFGVLYQFVSEGEEPAEDGYKTAELYLFQADTLSPAGSFTYEQLESSVLVQVPELEEYLDTLELSRSYYVLNSATNTFVFIALRLEYVDWELNLDVQAEYITVSELLGE